MVSLAAPWLVIALVHIWPLMVVGLFFAVLLTPPVDFVRRKLHVSKAWPRPSSCSLPLGLLAGRIDAFVAPLVDQRRHVVGRFPVYLEDARAGRGPSST